MRPYEVMIIFDVNLEEGDIRERVDRLVELIKSGGGKAGNVEHWGRRTFAYELKHRNEGYYVLVEMVVEPPTIAGVDRMLTLEDAVLRHKVIRLPEHVAGRSRASQRRPSDRASRAPAASEGATVAANAAEEAGEPVGSEEAETEPAAG